LVRGEDFGDAPPSAFRWIDAANVKKRLWREGQR
jgi:hypothetical protein